MGQPPLAMAEPPLRWWEGVLVAGHGVASGRATGSPYPAGTIALQTPHFAAAGVDLSPYLPATLNLAFPGGRWQLCDPHHRVPQLRWTDRHPPETFSFWRCQLRPADGADAVAALIYYPHPETKRAHHQPEGLLELLAPPLGPLPPGTPLALGVDPRRCRLIQPARLRARLLEFLKFRVLAAQDAFFEGSDPPALRAWLCQHWPEAGDLSDGELAATLEQARLLYTEDPRRGPAPRDP
jgi:hypothetical protein